MNSHTTHRLGEATNELRQHSDSGWLSINEYLLIDDLGTVDFLAAILSTREDTAAQNSIVPASIIVTYIDHERVVSASIRIHY